MVGDVEGFEAAASESIAQIVYVASRSAQGGVVVPGDAARGNSTPRKWSWAEVGSLACRVADSLARHELQPGDRVAIVATNSLDWIVAELAVQILGCVLVPLHGSLAGPQLAWQIKHSGSRLLIAAGAAIVDKLGDLDAELQVVVLTPAGDPRIRQPLPLWSDLIAAGNEAAGHERWQKTLRTVTPTTLASIVYTSGTSGEPRGVMLTQRNLAENALGTLRAFHGSPDDCRLNALPFSHAFGRMSDLLVSIAGQTRLALARSRESLLADAQQVRPTLMVVVPLLLARLRQAAVAQFGAADQAALQKLLGGRLRGFICGGAALADDLRDYFTSQGTPVCEGYGLTEAAPVVSATDIRAVDQPNAAPRNSVGRLLPNLEARTADDGELLIRGPQVMAGYWQDEAATREVLRDGWLHTGDLGTVDPNRFLFLHGRKKEFIALASGKKIWPAAIESLFAGDPLIEQIMLVGEGEAALGALIVPRQREASDLNSAENRQHILNHLAVAQSAVSAHEQIRRVWLLPEPWTAEREELTPKLTLRRTVILRRYADDVRRMFAGE